MKKLPLRTGFNTIKLWFDIGFIFVYHTCVCLC